MKTTPSPAITPAREGTLGLPPCPRLPIIADCLDGSETVESWLARHGVKQVRGVIYGVARAK